MRRPRPKLTPAQIRVLQEYIKLGNQTQIAARLGISQPALNQALTRLGLYQYKK